MNTSQPFPATQNIRFNESMSRHTSWRIGGPVDVYFKPRDRDDLVGFLTALDDDMPVLWVGLGSNLLVRDGGFRGAVIATYRAFAAVETVAENKVYAEAGVACAKLARKCGKWGYGDAHFFAGIPGTVGGALAMNAGAFGGETWDFVEQVETIDRAGTIRHRMADEFAVAYRQVNGPAGEWFLSARFGFAATDKDAGAKTRDMLARRKATQPLGLPSCGSVFRNPDGDHAARMIEAVGLKGHQIGGAGISPKHANFIINNHNASAADVEALIALIRQRVHAEFGVMLQPEVRVVGDPA